MVTPLILESTWRSLLGGLPEWTPRMEHALVISPHPDDETLGAGGLIALLRSRGVEVTVVAVTDGENAYADTPRQAETRAQEQTEALEILGVEAEHILRLRLPDSGLAEQEEQLVTALQAIATGEMHVIAPWRGDFHPDHEVCGRAAERVARHLAIPLTSYFFWTWHRAEVDVLRGMRLVALPLSPAHQAVKLQALSCHRTQLSHPSGQPILPGYLLGPAERPYEVFLPS